MSKEIEQIIIKSNVEYIEPPAGSNVAREIIRSLKGKNASKIVLVDGKDDIGREFTGIDVWQRTARLASGLMKSGLNMQVGDRVLLLSDHCTHDLLIALATLYTGACFIGCTPCSFEYVRGYCEPAQPNVIVTVIDHLKLALRAKRQLPGMGAAKIVLMDRKQESARELQVANCNEDDFKNTADVANSLGANLFDWPELDEELIMQRVEHEIKPKEHYMTVFITSGSTGRSKMVPWTHEHSLCNLWTERWPNRSADDVYSLRENCIVSGNNPLDAGANFMLILWCFIVGDTYVLMKCDDCQQFWRDVCKYKITKGMNSCAFTYKLLKQLIEWLQDGHDDEHIDVSSMDYLVCAGHRINLDPLLSVLRPHYPRLEVTQFYGTTEIGFISLLSCEDARKSFDCLGNLYPSVSAKVVDVETGKCLGPGKQGEMLVKSPSLFDAYLPHPEERLEDLMRDRLDEQGFYRTGDLVHYDEQGRFYMRGRLKEFLLLNGGWKIWPSDLERVVNLHPLVESSVVVGIPNTNLEGIVLPKAFVKLKSVQEAKNSSANGTDRRRLAYLIELLESGSHEQIVDDILQFSKIDLCEEQYLTGGIKLVDDFPRIGVLRKIDRNRLAQMN